MGWASPACFTGLVRLIPCFLIKFSLCLYEGVGGPACRGCSSRDFGKEASLPPRINTMKLPFKKKQGMSRVRPANQAGSSNRP